MVSYLQDLSHFLLQNVAHSNPPMYQQQQQRWQMDQE
jgi:hypothetical protein